MRNEAGKKITQSKWHGIKKRCQYPKCKKRAKDLINNIYLCRIHSEMREGFKG